MERIALVMAVVAMAGCSKGEEKPAAATPAADTSHPMMMMSDTSKKMMMGDTSKKMAPAPAAAAPAPAKAPTKAPAKAPAKKP